MVSASLAHAPLTAHTRSHTTPSTIPAIPRPTAPIRLQRIYDYIESLTGKPGTYTRGPWSIAITDTFHAHRSGDLFALQTALASSHLPMLTIQIYPTVSFENPMPSNWTSYDKDRTVWIYRGQRAVGYVRL